MKKLKARFANELVARYNATPYEIKTIQNVFLGTLASSVLWICFWSLVFSNVFLPFALLAVGIFTLVSTVITILAGTVVMFAKYDFLDRR